MKNNEKIYDVGIISFNMNTNFSNFGAALHSIAFQKYLDSINVKSIIVNYRRGSVLKQLWGIIKRYKFKAFGVLKNSRLKKKKFDKFFKEYCVTTNKIYTKNNFKTLKNIKQFCCETDITWCRFKDGYDRAFMCDYPNQKNKDNFAYSVDFGSNLIKEEYKKELKGYAQNFKCISIRNVFKLDYIKNVIERDDVEICIDPVFLIDKEDWQKISQKKNIEKNYVLIYNCKENHPEMVNKSIDFAKSKGLDYKIINCYDPSRPVIFDDNPTPVGIEEFLTLIENCTYMCTNSYHGLCFAIIYNVPFFAFSRKGNNEKILTILEQFDLNKSFIADEIIETEINWEDVNNKIIQKRERAEIFIKKSIFKENN